MIADRLELMRQELARRCREARRCEEPRCGQRTAEGKPYCSRHVGRMPHVAELLAELEAREDELVRVAGLGAAAVNVDGSRARELLQRLRLQGPATVQRLGRELDVGELLARCYVDALAAAGLVEVARTRRGKLLARAAAAERQAA